MHNDSMKEDLFFKGSSSPHTEHCFCQSLQLSLYVYLFRMKPRPSDNMYFHKILSFFKYIILSYIRILETIFTCRFVDLVFVSVFFLFETS